MMISSKYSKPTIPFFSFFISIFNLFLFSKDRFVLNTTSCFSKPQSRTVCTLDGCTLCVDLCPTRVIQKEGQSIVIASVACVECELCLERCPQKFIRPKNS